VGEYSSLNFTDGTQFSATDNNTSADRECSDWLAVRGGHGIPWGTGAPLGIRGKGELREAFSINL